MDAFAPPWDRARHGGVDEIPLPSGSGRLWLCGKHFVGPDPEAALVSVGASTIVCLTETYELRDRYPAYLEWLAVNVPVRAVRHPIPDLHAPDLARTRTLLDDLRRRLDAGEGLLVHCAAGIGRAGTIATALLITMDVPLATAGATVAAHRPMAGPEAGAQRELLEFLARQDR